MQLCLHEGWNRACEQDGEPTDLAGGQQVDESADGPTMDISLAHHMRATKLIVGVLKQAMQRVASHCCGEKNDRQQHRNQIHGPRPNAEPRKLGEHQAGKGVHQRGAVADVDIGRGLGVVARDHAAIFLYASDQADHEECAAAEQSKIGGLEHDHPFMTASRGIAVEGIPERAGTMFSRRVGY